ncbi:MAG TPA: MvdD family ATP-grasp ribosomal peptide maturase [Candidatus Xenobia bacterium]
MSILLVTHSQDPAGAELAAALEAQGAVPVRLDTDLYPHEVRLTTSYRDGEVGGWLVTAAGRFPLADVTAVWYRRFAAARGLPAELGSAREACVEESRKTLFGMIASLPVLHIDPIRRVLNADHKELQLRLAMGLGLQIPRTLFSNDEDVVRQFYHQLNGAVVCKLHGNYGVENQFVYTNRLRQGDLAGLKDLRYSPMIFQEAVPKRLELRATVVGRRVFTAAVDSQRSERSQTDWRRDPEAMAEAWESYTLPADVESGLLRLTARLGLNYGGADFILTPDGRHVFLEVNSGGEWLWLARKPGLPIAQALAELLVGRSEPIDPAEVSV